VRRDSLDGVERLRELGKAVAAHLDANPDAFVGHACLACGVSRRNHDRWMAADDEPARAYADEVLAAIYRQVAVHEKRAEAAIGSTENGSSAWANWHRWKLERRFRTIYGDLSSKHVVEVTGKDGGPLRSESTVLTAEGAAQLKREILFGKKPTQAGDGETLGDRQVLRGDN
jgi:hypothetical protein